MTTFGIIGALFVSTSCCLYISVKNGHVLVPRIFLWYKKKGALFIKRLPSTLKRILVKPMLLAGYSEQDIAHQLVKLILSILVSVVFAWVINNLLVWALCIIIVAINAKPLLNSSRAASARRKEAIYQLPGVLDVLSLLVVAGYPVSSALQLILKASTDGPLLDCLKTSLNRMKTGDSFADAIEWVYESLPCPQVRIFVNLLKQSAMQGSSLSQHLDKQSKVNRDLVEAEVEKQAQETPVKLLAPLALIIFPATMLPFIGLIWIKLQ